MMKKCQKCGRTFSDKKIICPHCGERLEPQLEDPNRGFRRRKPIVIAILLLLVLFAGGFGYITYLDINALGVLYPYFIGTGVLFLVMMLLFPRAQDERPLGIAALCVMAVAIAFFIYALVEDCVLGLVSAITYFRGLFQGGGFSLKDLLLNATAAFLLVALIVSFIGFGILAKGLASIQIPFIQPSPVIRTPCLSEPESKPASKAEPHPEVTEHPFDLASTFSLGRKASLAFVSFALVALALVAGGAYYLYFVGLYPRLFSLFTALPFALALAAMILVLPSGVKKRSLYLTSAFLSLLSALSSLVVAGFFVYFSILERSYADLFTLSFAIFAGESLGLLLAAVLAFGAFLKILGLWKLSGKFPVTVGLTPKAEAPAESSKDVVEVKGALEAPSPQSKSSFDGTFGSYFGNGVVNFLLTVCTLGLAYPWVYCRKIRFRAEHTVYSGYRVDFSGRGGQIFARWVGWFFLSLVTLGVYVFWIPGKLKDFEAKHSRLTLELA